MMKRENAYLIITKGFVRRMAKGTSL
jgi:hypothetical protein